MSVAQRPHPATPSETPKAKSASKQEAPVKCQHPAKRREIGLLSFGSTVDIFVGAEKTKFTIHKALLLDSAPFFKAALDGHFREAEEERLYLPTQDASVFERFQLWLYTGESHALADSLKERSSVAIINLYIFADEYGIFDLLNTTMDLLVARRQGMKRLLEGRSRYIYENTVPSSPLRRLLVDVVAQDKHLWKRFEDSDSVTEHPVEFIADVIKRLSALAQPNAKWIDFSRVGCEYHVHSSGPSQ